MKKLSEAIKENKEYLTRQQILTLRGQAKAGNVAAAFRGLEKILEKSKNMSRQVQRVRI